MRSRIGMMNFRRRDSGTGSRSPSAPPPAVHACFVTTVAPSELITSLGFSKFSLARLGRPWFVPSRQFWASAFLGTGTLQRKLHSGQSTFLPAIAIGTVHLWSHPAHV